MARMGDQPQPSGMDKNYSDYHVKRSTKSGGNGEPSRNQDSSGH
jgi:hypothetical protein